MKMTAFAALFLYGVVSLCVSASAASYTDDMDGLNTDAIKQYSQLSQYSFGRGESAVPDATAATFSGGQLSAYAQYRVGGATSVVASIYSRCGTFVCQSPDAPGTYILGIFRENMDFVMAGNPVQALYCASTNGVYTYEGGLKQMYMDVNGVCYFGGAITQPAGDVIGYGVNIYYSADGRQFFRAPSKMTYLKSDDGYCYERYTAAVPEAAKYVKVEINDVSSVPLAGGGARPKDKKSQTALASVTITGDKLVMGEPEPAAAAMLPGMFADGNYYSAVRDDSKDVPDEAGKSEAAKASAKSGEASSKFEGTITSSSKSERAPSSKAEKKSAVETAEPTSAAPSEQANIPPDQTIVNHIQRAAGGTGFNGGVTAYIIIVAGAITALAVMQKRK